MNLPIQDPAFLETKYSGGISSFYEWFALHKKLKSIPQDIMKIISRAFKKSDCIHRNDTRDQDKSPYMYHIFRVVLSIIEKYPTAYPADILALTLHDTIEDHPEYWYDILSEFGLEVFRNILVLSKISIKTRTQILEWLIEVIPSEGLDDKIIGNIFQILSPQDPLIKLKYFSQYSDDCYAQDTQKMEGALLLYRDKLIVPKGGDYTKNDEYISLGNYLYFEKRDARRKLQDMLDNISDMEKMEQKKPGYIEKRRIKAYILGVKLRNFGMHSEYAELQGAFHDAGYAMLHDAEILNNRDGEDGE